MAAYEALHVDRSKINEHFEGYKLSLDIIPQYIRKLDTDVGEVKLSDEMYSYQHVKAFGLHNYLVLDTWTARKRLYYVDNSDKVVCVPIDSPEIVEPSTVAFELPGEASEPRGDGFPPSLHFNGPEWACVGDGLGKLYILNTGNRDLSTQPWTAAYSGNPCDDQPFFVLDSIVNDGHGSTLQTDCLLFHVKKMSTFDEVEISSATKSNKSEFITVLDWITFTQEEGGLKVSRRRRLEGNVAPSYAALELNRVEQQAAGVHLMVDNSFHFVYDDCAPVTMETDQGDQNGGGSSPIEYSWTQTSEDVTVTLFVSADLRKQDIEYSLSPDSIRLCIKNLRELLVGQLWAPVDVECCTWILTTGKLEVMLSKKEEGPFWKGVVEGDERGQYVSDPDEVRRVHEQLAHLTSETLVGDGDNKASITGQELEECDVITEDYMVLIRLDGESHNTTHKVCLNGNQWLFNVQRSAAAMPAFCLRHDVDGLLWQPCEPTQNSAMVWNHRGTFSALGYVQAGKQNKKFSTCSPSLSFAVLCDWSRHIYIYRQPSQALTPIRNRKTGQVISQVSKQHLISLDSNDAILGLQADDQSIFVLTATRLYTLKMN